MWSLVFLHIYFQFICLRQFYVSYPFVFFLAISSFFFSFAIYHLAECGCESVKRRLQTHAAFYYNFETFALDLERFECAKVEMVEYDQ